MKTAVVVIASVITLFFGSITQLSAAEELYQFSPGANLFAYPVDPGSAYLAADLLADLNSQAAVSSIQHYSTAKGLFETCVWKNGSASGADFPVLTTEGYIVHTTENFTYQVFGERICPPIALAPGLNIAVFPCAATDYNAYQLLEDLGPTVIAVKKQDPTDNVILSANRENGVNSGNNFDIEHGSSYLIYMEETNTWYPTTKLDAPQDFNGYAGDELVILTWTEPSGLATGYNVYKTTTPGSNYQKVNTLPIQDTEFTNSGLTNNEIWYYTIYTIDQYGRESEFFATTTVTPIANTGPTTISGTLIAEATWTLAGSPYIIDIGGGVDPGATLTIEPGVVVELSTSTNIIDIYGTLIAKGTPNHPIVFQAEDNAWTGLSFEDATSTNSVLKYVHIEDASEPLEITDSSPEISHCELLGTSSRGIELLRSDAHIHHTSISGSYSSMYGIYMTDSSPLVEYNQISSPGSGIYMYSDSSPQILNNSIKEFRNIGLDLSGASLAQPYPTIIGNSIETNRGGSSTYLLRTSNYSNNPAAGIHRTVNAKNNYWGTTDPQIITASVVQWARGTSDEPYVDFSEFLDGLDGNVVPGNFIPSGPLSPEELSWSSEESPYIILGNALVENGHELVIAPGTEVRFAGGGDVYGYRRDRFSSLQIMGTLTAVGTPDSFIHFLSDTAIPEKSDWYGIVFLENSNSDSIVSYSRIEHAYIGVRSYAESVSIANNEIIAGNGTGQTWATGIYLQDGNTSEITNNKVSGYTYYDSSGLFSINSAPTITGNTFDSNRVGIYIKADSYATIPVTPVVTGNEIINSTVNSFYLYGASDDTKSPAPVINNNTIITPAVTTASFQTSNYGANSTILINAKNNWWGTYNAADIAKTVYDKNDHSYSPLVDYRFFLNDAEGQPGTGTQILGYRPAGEEQPLWSTATWSTVGSPYKVMGDLNIPLGKTLTIEAGVEVWMSSGSTVNVEGELFANGTTENPIKFSAGSMTETPTDWEGIVFASGSDNSILSYCSIENAKLPIYMEDSSPEISHCDIVDASSTYYSLRLLRSNAHIHHSTISSNYDTEHGLYLNNSSPLIEYNEIIGMRNAMDVQSSSNPQILHNVIQNYTYTAFVCDGYYGDSFPVINYNTIQTNRGDYNTWAIRTSYYGNDPGNGAVQTIDAKDNYWGTDNPQLISGGIDQWSGGTSTDPFVDFSGFLDGPDGTAVAGHFIAPGIVSELTWDSAQGPYIVLGHAVVPNGQELTVSPGTEVRFLGGSESVFSTTRDVRSSLRIYGKLTAVGNSGSMIYFSSNHRNPTEGNWTGIVLYNNSDDTSLISYSKIEHAFNGVYCIGASPEISHNTIIAGPGNAYSSYLYGIRLEEGSAPDVSNNLITGFNYSGCDGINILDSSPTISGNTIEDNYYGVYVKDGSPSISSNIIIGSYYGLSLRADSNTAASITPSIASNSIIDSTYRSVYIYGSGDDTTSPLPVFSNNSFVTQHSPEQSFEAYYYSSSSNVTLNAEGNWWGTTVQSEIEDIIYDSNDSTSRRPLIDFQPYDTQAPSSSLLYQIDLSEQWFSPNNDGNQDSVTISWQGSADITNWTMTVKNNSNQIVRTEVIGSVTEWTWDGKNDSGVQVGDGQYTLFISGSNANGSVERDMSVNIDTQPVTTIQIHSPIEAENLQNIFNIIATIEDGNLNDYILEIGKGSSPSSWKQLKTGSVNIDLATLYTLESNTIDTDTIPSLATVGNLTDGPYTLRLTATDIAGNTSVVNRNISLENIFFTNVTTTELVVDLTISQSASVEFTIDKTADVELRIYTEAEGEIDQLVRVISQSPLAAGTHSVSWDGRDDSAEYVAVGGYIFVLSAETSSGLTDKFITNRTLNQPASWTPMSSFNASTNDWFTADCTMENVPGHYRVQITPSGETAFNVYTKYYAAHESFLFTWDGRRPDGTLVDANTAFWIFDTWGNANMFIVRSSSEPEVTGQAPHVNVKSDPSLINFCYGEQTSLLYNLDRQAEITITLFPIEVDASSPNAIVLVDHQIQSAGDHSVTWSGTDVSDVRNVLFSQEGQYTFVIEATSEGVTSTSRGVVSLYK